MRKGIYCIYDSKAQRIVGGLMIQNHAAVAVRDFTDAMKQVPMIREHPEDFELLELGYLNEPENAIIGINTLEQKAHPRAVLERSVMLTGSALAASLNMTTKTPAQAPAPQLSITDGGLNK